MRHGSSAPNIGLQAEHGSRALCFGRQHAVGGRLAAGCFNIGDLGPEWFCDDDAFGDECNLEEIFVHPEESAAAGTDSVVFTSFFTTKDLAALSQCSVASWRHAGVLSKGTVATIGGAAFVFSGDWADRAFASDGGSGGGGAWQRCD